MRLVNPDQSETAEILKTKNYSVLVAMRQRGLVGGLTCAVPDLSLICLWCVPRRCCARRLVVLAVAPLVPLPCPHGAPHVPLACPRDRVSCPCGCRIPAASLAGCLWRVARSDRALMVP